MRRHVLVPFLLCLALASGCAPVTKPLGDPELPYPPAREPVVGDILHLPTGVYVHKLHMLAAVSDERIVYVGETHDNPASHRVQLEVLRSLAERYPGKVALGMEMFVPAQQPVLDAWTAGELSEKEFLKQSDWYTNWRMNFAYYRDLLDLARDRHIPVVGLNADKDLVEAIGRNTPEELDPEMRARLPEMDLDDPYQRAMTESIFSGHQAGNGMIEGFLRVQTLWDEAMATSIAGYLEKNPQMHMVVVAGGNHIRHGFGIPRRVFRRLPISYALVGTKEIDIPEGLENRMMDVVVPHFPMPAFDYLAFTSYETLPPEVKLGIVLEEKEEGVFAESIIPGSTAEEIGLQPGDRIKSINGEPVAENFDLIYVVQQQKPGDQGTLEVERAGETLRFDLTFREVSPMHHQMMKK